MLLLFLTYSSSASCQCVGGGEEILTLLIHLLLHLLRLRNLIFLLLKQPPFYLYFGGKLSEITFTFSGNTQTDCVDLRGQEVTGNVCIFRVSSRNLVNKMNAKLDEEVEGEQAKKEERRRRWGRVTRRRDERRVGSEQSRIHQDSAGGSRHCRVQGHTAAREREREIEGERESARAVERHLHAVLPGDGEAVLREVDKGHVDSDQRRPVGRQHLTPDDRHQAAGRER